MCILSSLEGYLITISLVSFFTSRAKTCVRLAFNLYLLVSQKLFSKKKKETCTFRPCHKSNRKPWSIFYKEKGADCEADDLQLYKKRWIYACNIITAFQVQCLRFHTNRRWLCIVATALVSEQCVWRTDCGQYDSMLTRFFTIIKVLMLLLYNVLYCNTYFKYIT